MVVLYGAEPNSYYNTSDTWEYDGVTWTSVALIGDRGLDPDLDVEVLTTTWIATFDGLVRYEMVSLTGSPKRPELSRFVPPE